MTGKQLYETVRQPEYTGENRCPPCTVVNVLIAVLVSTLLGVLSVIVGLGVFAASLGVIYLRGYLVPGTPTLTERYLPERILGYFGKQTAAVSTVSAADRLTPVVGDEPESVLRAGGVIEDTDDGDVDLTAGFRDEWRTAISQLQPEGEAEEAFAGQLGISQEELVFLHHGGAHVVNHDGTLVGTWESRAAFVADVAAERVLEPQVAGWRDRSPERRSDLVAGLRPFIEQCPDCGEPVTVATETVESCCSERSVLAAACTECDARLFEVDAPEQKAQ